MQHLDMRYHVISIVAIFLALGVGIFVGSNTNFMNVKILIKRQDALIHRLEQTQKDLKKEKEEAQATRREDQQYIKSLEEKSFPLLMSDRLSGIRLGLAAVGDFPIAGINENVMADILERSGADVAYRVHLSLPGLSQMAGGHTGNLANDLAGELVHGGSLQGMTTRLARDGWLLQGDFQRPVQGLVFVIGDNLNPRLAEQILFPLEHAVVQKHHGIAANAAFGSDRERERLFRKAGIALLSDIETVPAQVEFVTGLWTNVKQPGERFNPDTDLTPAAETGD